MNLYDTWTIHLAAQLLGRRDAATEEENKRLKEQILVLKEDNVRIRLIEKPKQWQFLHLQAHAEINALKEEIKRQEERYALLKSEHQRLKADHEFVMEREVYG